MMDAPCRLLAADPPWPFKDRLPGEGGAARHYGLMTVDQIAGYQIPPLAQDALLVLWRVGAQQEEALRVCRAWGFTPTSELVWIKTRACRQHHPAKGRAPAPPEFRARDCYGCTANALLLKLHFGMGRTVRNCHESAIVGLRGRARHAVSSHSIRSAVLAPFLGHSRKPEEALDAAEALAGSGPRVELFARRRRPGWTCIGDQLPQVKADRCAG